MKRFRKLSVLGLATLLVGLLGVISVQAAPPAPANFTVAAGQSATVRINVFCLDFGKDFPAGQNIQPGAAAAANLQGALAYAIDKGYDQSDPRQVQLALWYLRDNTWHTNAGENKDKAQEIVDNASKGPTVAAGTGTALADAVKNNQVTVTATGVQPLTQGEFYGTAVLQVQNSGSSSLNLSLAPGTTFTATSPNAQLLIGYPTGATGSGAAQATTTAAATTAAATTAAATTAAATTAATTTAAATTAATTAPATTAAAATTAAPATTAAATTAAPTTVAAASTTPVSSLPASGQGGTASNADMILPVSILILVAIAAIAGTSLLILSTARRTRL